MLALQGYVVKKGHDQLFFNLPCWFLNSWAEKVLYGCVIGRWAVLETECSSSWRVKVRMQCADFNIVNLVDFYALWWSICVVLGLEALLVTAK